MPDPPIRSLARNRRARHDYHLLDTFEAGIALSGTEVKSVRQGKIQLRDGFVEMRGREAWLLGVHIGAYSHGNRENHEPERPRKLLLRRRELDRLLGRSKAKGTTIVPLQVYLKGNWIKVELALAMGKKQYDKRQAEREREAEREMRAALSHRGKR